MKPRHSPWFAIAAPLAGRRAVVLKVLSFILPVAVWCVVSYVPWIWHPMVHVTDPGASDFLQEDMLIKRADFAEENAKLAASGQPQAKGFRANPIFLPAPHEVAKAFVSSFTTPPYSPTDPTVGQSLWHSAQIIFMGFFFSAIVGVPIGVMCGTFDLFSKLFEPVIDFVRYMPAPAFGALSVAVLGIDDGPKVAIIWVGTFFQMVLVVANTTRQMDLSLLEAAQTLGANRATLIPKVILPAIVPNLYNDMRILIGWAWTYLIVAELIGAGSGISYFINQQGKHFHFPEVYAGMLMIGIIGLACDQLLATAAPLLFPWLPRTERASVLAAIVGAFTFMPQRALARRAAERRAGRERREPAAVPVPATTITPPVAMAQLEREIEAHRDEHELVVRPT